MQLHRNPLPPISRRDALHRIGAGFGSLGLAGLFNQSATAGQVSPLAPKAPHFAPKAKHVIQLFMPGGPSQVDTFDYKPKIADFVGQRPKIVDRKSLRNTKNGLFPSPFGFKRYGQTGKWVSDIFPHTAKCSDDICFIHSMHTNIPEHAGAMMMFNLGHLQPSRPSLGSWLCYGLGTENQELPGLVAMSPRAKPRGKAAHWGNSFLPGAYAGVYANIAEMKPDSILRDLKNPHLSRTEQRQQANLLAQLNQFDLERQQQDQKLESSIQAMEMAFRMQTSVPELTDISGESKHTLDMYGPEVKKPGTFAAGALGSLICRLTSASSALRCSGVFFCFGSETSAPVRNMNRDCFSLPSVVLNLIRPLYFSASVFFLVR